MAGTAACPGCATSGRHAREAPGRNRPPWLVDRGACPHSRVLPRSARPRRRQSDRCSPNGSPSQCRAPPRSPAPDRRPAPARANAWRLRPGAGARAAPARATRAPPHGDEHAHRGAHPRQEKRFGDELAHQTPLAGAERPANRQFASPLRRPRQQKMGDVRARHQQKKTDRAQQEIQRRAHRPVSAAWSGPAPAPRIR